MNYIYALKFDDKCLVFGKYTPKYNQWLYYFKNDSGISHTS